jgi:hypothetical protein
LDEVIDDYMVTYYNYYGVEKGTEKYNAIVKNNLIKVLNTTFKVDDVYKADLAAEAAAFLMEDAGLTADEVTLLKGKLTITLQEIYDACQTETLLKNHEGVYMRNETGDGNWSETYLTKDYAYDYFPDDEFTFVKLMTDNACYYYDGGHRLLYTFVTPDGVGNFASERAEAFASMLVGEEIVDDMIESVEIKDGRITVTSVLSSKNIEILAEYGVKAGKYEYVLDATTREIISIMSEHTYDDGSVFKLTTELTYDAEEPEKLKEFLAYETQTENLRNVTVVSNPGTDKEESKSIQAPKGLIIGFQFDDEWENAVGFYTDAACTKAYDPYADTEADLTIYVKWNG